MAVTYSSMLMPLGATAPQFELVDTENKKFILANTKQKSGVLINFICNHCPFVTHIIRQLVEMALDYEKHNLLFVAINSNDMQQYPADNQAKMREFIAEYNLPFPYLIDNTQEVAKAYQATCTPDFFLFNHNHKLCYKGQFDASNPRNTVPTNGDSLRNAINNMLASDSKQLTDIQRPSVGCNIKWKPDNSPAYYNN